MSEPRFQGPREEPDGNPLRAAAWCGVVLGLAFVIAILLSLVGCGVQFRGPSITTGQSRSSKICHMACRSVGCPKQERIEICSVAKELP